MDLAGRPGSRPVQSAEIARRRGIPEPYLTQLLAQLRKSGLVISRRGRSGGHVLARPPAEITLADVVIALEGPLGAVVDDEGRWNASDAGALLGVWTEVTASLSALLSSITLADLLERSRRDVVSYQI
jgi:Rrf2 family transcriptional regulator, cysteine metabolism repressor